jgi:hypothetical protein
VYYYDFNNLKAIRKSNWKLVFPHTSQTYGPPATIGANAFPGKYGNMEVKMALYDLVHDPGEERDMQLDYPEIVKQLSEIADRYRDALGDGITKKTGKEVRPAAKTTP